MATFSKTIDHRLRHFESQQNLDRAFQQTEVVYHLVHVVDYFSFNLGNPDGSYASFPRDQMSSFFFSRVKRFI
jgi:hypothetical protein